MIRFQIIEVTGDFIGNGAQVRPVRRETYRGTIEAPDREAALRQAKSEWPHRMLELRELPARSST